MNKKQVGLFRDINELSLDSLLEFAKDGQASRRPAFLIRQ